ncbi:hypothetical protein GCM10022406_27800 [Hymenobacter algoricola]|uniref:Rubredoxin-like domain-containing protein n=1 Tax=Hymenobacter algoricola TaxID=486267 RepID=A0ABP7NDC2_9BACT
MGAKHVCFACRKAFNSPHGHIGPQKCPECGEPIVVLPQRFRPPRKGDDDKWATARFLVNHGFYYQHIGLLDAPPAGKGALPQYVPYPETVREAKEFIETYRAWARKKD